MLKESIIEKCKEYGYLLDTTCCKDGKTTLNFKNDNVVPQLSLFIVEIDEDLERVQMVVMYDLGAWNDALEYDLNELEEVLKGVELWISPKYLKEVEKWFLEE